MNYSILKDQNASGGLGEKLTKARERLGWRIEDAAKKTGIKISYLQALEQEQYQQIPGGLYAKKYLKKYAKTLNLSGEKIDEQFAKNENILIDDDLFGKKTLSKKQMLAFPKILRRLSLVLVILLCSLYLLLYFKKMFLPPKLIIYSPEKDLITKERTIIVAGKVESESELKINDEIIPQDKKNNFSQKISLKKGINHLVIKAKKKHSQVMTITRQVLVE